MSLVCGKKPELSEEIKLTYFVKLFSLILKVQMKHLAKVWRCHLLCNIINANG